MGKRNAILLLAFLALAGCRYRYEYTINPDGTGKVAFSAAVSRPPLDVEQKAALFITGSRGVDAWSDVAYAKENGTTFTATAYFKNLADLNLYDASKFMPGLKDNADGTKTLTIVHDGHDTDFSKKAYPDSEIPKMTAKARVDYERWTHEAKTDGTLESTLTIVIDPPGKVRSVTNMKLREDGKLEVTYDFRKLHQAIGDMVASDETLREILKSGETVIRRGKVTHGMINERLFGTRGPVQAVLEGPFEPKFDYGKEAAAAETDTTKVEVASGVLREEMPEPGANGNIRNATCNVAVRKNNLSGRIRGELPRTGYRMVNVELFRVVDDKGRRLLPGKGAKRFPYGGIEEDGRVAGFDLVIRDVPGDTAALKYVGGLVRYRALGPLKEENLGTFRPASGARLDRHKFVMTRYETHKVDGSIILQWQAMLPPMAVKLVLLDGGKNFLAWDFDPEPEPQGVARPFVIMDPKQVPPKALTAVVYTVERYDVVEAPFVIENVPVKRESAAGR